MITRMEQRRMERMRAKIISAIFVLMALLIAFMLGYYFGGTAEAAEEPEPVQYIPDEPKVVTLPEIEEPEEPEPPTLTSIGEFTITAYCACEKCCGKDPSHPAYGITASGTEATQGRTIATDPSVIPTGSVVYFDGIDGLTGGYIAEDAGAAIKGNKIDLFFDSHQDALEWGVQTKEVFVIE